MRDLLEHWEAEYGPPDEEEIQRIIDVYGLDR